MNYNFKNKIVAITGASAGIGRATSYAFAKEGAKLALISRNLERLKSLEKEARDLGSPEVLIFSLDVSRPEKINQAVEEIEKKMGPIDIWVNNAMVSVFAPVKEMEPEEFKRVTEVTYLGYVYSTLAVLKKMLQRDRGTIIQVGSALAYRGIPLQSAYCAAKHAIQGFHDSLTTELLHDRSNVKATMIQFPAFNTPQFDWSKSKMKYKAQPVPPIYQPEIAADAILWAATHPKKEYIIGFSAMAAVWGDKLFSPVADWYLANYGYDSQQTGDMEDPKREDDLMETVSGNFGAHGRFDQRASSTNWHLWYLKRKRKACLVFGFLGILMFFRALKRK